QVPPLRGGARLQAELLELRSPAAVGDDARRGRDPFEKRRCHGRNISQNFSEIYQNGVDLLRAWDLRSSGRTGARVRSVHCIKHMFTSTYKPLEVLTAEQVAFIDRYSMRILEEIGLVFREPRAVEVLVRAGARHDERSGRIRIPEALVREAVRRAPHEFT